MPYGTINADLMTTSDGVSSSGLYGFKNRIINGAMVVNQRATAVTASAYTVDRWSYNGSQNSKATASQDTSVYPTGFNSSLKILSSSAYSIVSGDYFTIEQPIEGLNCIDLGWGASGAVSVTLSFWVRSSLTGTFGGVLYAGSGSYSYPFSYTISSANTWEQKSVTIAGPTSGTFVTTNATCFTVCFGLGVGSTYSGTAGSWQASVLRSVTGATSVVGTNGATFYITGVQLEKGSTATSFDYRPYTTELQLCQRYFVSLQEGIWTANGSGTATAGLYLPVTMRATPTLYATPAVMTIWDPQITSYTQSSVSGSLPLGGPSKDFVIIQSGNFSGMNTGRTLFWQSGGAILLGAEL